MGFYEKYNWVASAGFYNIKGSGVNYESIDFIRRHHKAYKL